VKAARTVRRGEVGEVPFGQLVGPLPYAEVVEKYASKGTLVFVQGRLQVQKYKDKQHIERTSVEISASNVQILEKKPKEGDGLPDEVLPEA